MQQLPHLIPLILAMHNFRGAKQLKAHAPVELYEILLADQVHAPAMGQHILNHDLVSLQHPPCNPFPLLHRVYTYLHSGGHVKLQR